MKSKMLRFLKVIIAMILILPTTVLSGPLIIWMYVNHNDGTMLGKKTIENVLRSNWTTIPYLWVHKTLFCSGDKSRQKF